jgi:hypothetical protein
MGTSRRSRAILAVIAIVAIGGTGCFGYNRSAKGWSYVGDSVLIAGGGGAIAAGVLTKDDPAPCMTNRMCPYDSPITGMMVVGVVLATAGLVGIIVNATRPNVKTSR